MIVLVLYGPDYLSLETRLDCVPCVLGGGPGDLGVRGIHQVAQVTGADAGLG